MCHYEDSAIVEFATAMVLQRIARHLDDTGERATATSARALVGHHQGEGIYWAGT